MHVGNAGAKLDEREDCNESNGHVYGVDRDFESGRNGTEDARERETLVTGEREELAGVGSHDSDTGENTNGEHHNGQDGSASGGASGVEEDLHEADYSKLASLLE